MSEAKQGWANLDSSNPHSKYHYFPPPGTSLCGRVKLPRASIRLEDSNDNHADNCATCRAKIAPYRAESSASA